MANFDGGISGDVFNGTSAADTINGNGGNDVINDTTQSRLLEFRIRLGPLRAYAVHLELRI